MSAVQDSVRVSGVQISRCVYVYMSLYLCLGVYESISVCVSVCVWERVCVCGGHVYACVYGQGREQNRTSDGSKPV